jgi:hypothetical protein
VASNPEIGKLATVTAEPEGRPAASSVARR